MVIAEISADGWVIIISAIGVALVNVVTAWRSSSRQDTIEKKLDVNTDITVQTAAKVSPTQAVNVQKAVDESRQ